ncbi:MAG: YraN family protein [Clostridiales bacterium]|nr:YraN family protein [Clostridiales bacterium]
MHKNQIIGKKGEDIAEDFLKKNKYKILERNFYCNQGEIDIIALNKKEIVFIEVKTRNNTNYGMPSEAVTKQKEKHFKRATEYYIYKNNLYNDFIRLDVIEVLFQGDKYTIKHIKQI